MREAESASREKGITSYGFGPFAMKPGDLLRVHGMDERIAVDSFTAGVRLMWEVVYDLSRAHWEQARASY